MRGDGIAGADLDGLDRPLEPSVVKRLELAAAVAHEVVMVAGTGARGLVASDAVADVDPHHGAAVDEGVDGPVHTGEADPRPAPGERLVDLLRAAAARLGAEVADHLGPGRADALARLRKPAARLVFPTGHAYMITVIV